MSPPQARRLGCSALREWTARPGGPLRRALFCLALGALAPGGEALALWDDQLLLYAAQAAYRDDNVLRRPPGGEIYDTYRVTTLGLNLDLPLGQQRVLGSLKVDSIRYDAFGELDLDAHDGAAQWQWRLERDVTGKLGFSHRRALASLANVQGGELSTVPNVLTTQRLFATSEYPLSPRWQLELEASRLEQSNGADLRRPNDLVLDRGEAGLVFVSRAGNRLGVRGRVARGELPNPELIGTTPIDNSYQQVELGVTGDWRPGGASRLRGHVSRLRRDYEQFPERDFEGNTFELALDWSPTGKLELSALAQRDISATEEINVSFVLAERVALSARYRASAMVDMTAALEAADRRYLGEARQVVGLVPQRTERLSTAWLITSYRPVPHVALSVSLRRETRSSEFAIGEYTVDTAGVQARFDF